MNSRLAVALATPLLILLALVALLGSGQRQGAERFQAVPAVLIGAGLLVAGASGYGRRRRRLLRALREKEPNPLTIP
jgi:peptidoglycan/LPS O-acetylase OafA/YrhL